MKKSRQQRKTRQQEAPRLTRRQILVNSTAQDCAHQNSYTINSRRRVLQFEADEKQISIIQLTAALNRAKADLARLEASIEGLDSVVARR